MRKLIISLSVALAFGAAFVPSPFRSTAFAMPPDGNTSFCFAHPSGMGPSDEVCQTIVQRSGMCPLACFDGVVTTDSSD